MKPNILLPAHIQRENQQREIKEQIAKQKVRHAQFLRDLKLELIAALPESGEVTRDAIYEICRILVNKTNRIVAYDLLTCAEMGQLISEVLLGPGVGYEIKTVGCADGARTAPGCSRRVRPGGVLASDGR